MFSFKSIQSLYLLARAEVASVTLLDPHIQVKLSKSPGNQWIAYSKLGKWAVHGTGSHGLTKGDLQRKEIDLAGKGTVWNSDEK